MTSDKNTNNEPPTTTHGFSHSWFSNLRNDVIGGTVSALIAIPLAMGFGMFAFVSLGEAYFAAGVLAGLSTAFVVTVVAVVLGDKSMAVYAPRVVTTFFIGAIILQTLQQSDAEIMRAGSAELTLGIVFAIVFLGGAFQALFGVLKIGTLIKYVPQPVMAGFQNAAALLVFLAQLGTVLGYEEHTALSALGDKLGSTKPLSVLVALLTIAVTWNARKFMPRLPPLLVGLGAGTILYYALLGAGLGGYVGPVIGPMPSSGLSFSKLPTFAELARTPGLGDIVAAIFTGAISLAIIASVDALLCARLLAGSTGVVPPTNPQLVRLGIGNMLAAGCGGITSGVNLGPSIANRAYGAATPLSVLVNAAIVLLTLTALMPAIAYLPRVALSAVIMVVAIQHIDPWSIDLARKLVTHATADRLRMALEMLVVVLVATVSLVANIVVAVFVGITVAISFFLVQMSKSVTRRAYRCDAVHSRRARDPRLAALLNAHGGKILVLELEGALFFGTAENLAADIETAMQQDTTHLILDLKHLREIDSTGARLILRVYDQITDEGKHLLLSSYPEGTPLAHLLREIGVTAAVTHAKLFSDVDRAIEWAEDDLLLAEFGDLQGSDEFPFQQLDLFADMDEHECEVMKAALSQCAYGKGDIVFREGDQSRELYVIAKGSASVRLRAANSDRETRLITFAPGTVFGELALLDREVRSATVEADGELLCYVLSADTYDALIANEPGVAVKLLVNLGRELASRLRRANRTIYQLAS